MMKKIGFMTAIVLIVVTLILFVPIPKDTYDDGGTREYEALTYKLVKWNRLTSADDVYRKTRIYWGQDRTLSIDELWYNERLRTISNAFDAVIEELTGDHAIVKAMPYEQESGLFSFSTAQLNTEDFDVGDTVRIGYTGEILETYPAQINVVEWMLQQDLHDVPFTDNWLDNTAPPSANEWVADVYIRSVYSNCFFVESAITADEMYKINGQLGNDWCTGDRVLITYRDYVYDKESRRGEATLVSIGSIDSVAESMTCAKPVIYLYPEEETEVDVTLTLRGELTCTYPAYKNGWHVTAAPDGTLTDERGQTYNYLYWEGDTDTAFDMSRGFCVKGDDTSAFLETALAELGLTRREANEFIVYWLPLMEQNPYNLIAFQTDAYTDAAKLDISPTPDTLIRVFIAFKRVDEFVDIAPQTLSAPARVGFTAVEWGGTEIQ